MGSIFLAPKLGQHSPPEIWQLPTRLDVTTSQATITFLTIQKARRKETARKTETQVGEKCWDGY
jgi:hypothetical protein